MLPNHNQLRGKTGENFASSYLKKKGYSILQRNFHARFGEIDIIAQKGNVLIFVEVKTRDSEKFGKPYEAVTPWKINSIVKTAAFYKILHPKTPETLQIDVLSLTSSLNGDITVEHLENVTS